MKCMGERDRVRSELTNKGEGGGKKRENYGNKEDYFTHKRDSAMRQ